MKFGDISSSTVITEGLDLQTVTLPKVNGLPDLVGAVQAIITNQNAIIAALKSAGLLVSQGLAEET